MTETITTASAPTAPMPGSIPRMAAIALGFGMLITSVGNNFLITIMPPLMREMGMSEVELGFLFGIAGLFMLITGPIWGRASESFGRKPILLIGGVGYVVTNTLFGAVIDARLALSINAGLAFTLMATTRGLYSLTSGAVYPTTMALVADLTSRENRASGVALIGATWGLGSVIGPGIAAALSGFGPTVPIYAVSVFATISTLLYVVNIHEPQRHIAQAKPSFRAVLNRQTLSIAGTFGLLIFGNVGLMVCLGFHFQDRFGLDTAGTTRAVGFAFSCQAIAQILVQVVLIKRLGWSPRKMVSVGMPIVMAASVTLMLSDNYILSLAAMMLMGLGGGFGWPAFMTASSLSAGPENQGSVAGLTTGFQSLGFMIGPMVGTAAYAGHHSYPFYFQIGIAALIVVIVNIIKMPRP